MASHGESEVWGALRARLLLALTIVAFLLMSSSSAVANVVVELQGSGAGTVTSNPPGINCSNLGNPGGPGSGSCGPVEVGEFIVVELTAAPDAGSTFVGWTADDEFGEFVDSEFPPSCNSAGADENPCNIVDQGAFGSVVHVTARFKRVPTHAPDVTTGGTELGTDEFLTSLQGTVDPEGFEVEDCQFEYGPTTKYGFQAPCVPGASELGEGNTPEPVHGEAELESLKPNTIYHYRVVASNSFGAGKGEDRTFKTGPAPSDACPNADIRAAQVFGAILLPDCMALEMVSPPVKGGQAAEVPVVSAEGERISFRSVAALGGTPGSLSPTGDPYIAIRGPSEWTTVFTSPPVDIFAGWESFATALSYTPDFSRWFQLGSTRPQFQLGMARAFQGGLGGVFTPISPLLVPLAGGETEVVQFSKFQGASTDHSHLYFIPGPNEGSAIAYLGGDPEPSGTAADHNTYVAHLDSGGQPALELLARDRSGKAWGGSCGARLGGVRQLGTPSERTGERNQGAIAADGGRVYFSTRPGQPVGGVCNTANKLRILKRLESSQGPWIGELFFSECNRAAPACSSVDGNDYYQGASIDGTRVYFTTNRQLADSDVDVTNEECSNTAAGEGCDLYLYDATLPPGQRLVQVSAGGTGDPTPGEGAKVLNGATAVSGDGSHVYFVAEGVLTAAENPEGDVAQEGEPNLYVWKRATEATSFVGTLDPADSGIGGALWGGSGIFAVPELGDGHVLPFVSAAALTDDDGDGTHLDVFRYDASSEELVRVSKAAPGGDDNGPFDVLGGDQNRVTLGTDFAERGRHTSEDTETLVFTTNEGLVPGDVNGDRDGYLWRSGQPYRLPGSSPAISNAGSTLAFASATALLPRDGDTSVDIYAARAGGGYPEPKVLEPCQPDKALSGPPCHPEPPPPPVPNTSSGNPPDPGNVRPKPRCRKGQVRRRGRCVKRPNRKHSKHARNANANRRAGK